ADDPERGAAVELGNALYDLLTRPADAPWRHGPGVPVRVGAEAGHVRLDEAQRLVLIPVLGEALLADESRRDDAIRQINAWHDLTGATGRVLPLLVDSGWLSHRSQLSTPSVHDELADGLYSALLGVLAKICHTLRIRDRAGRENAGTENQPKATLYISSAAEDQESIDAAQRISDVLADHAATPEAFDDIHLLGGEDRERQPLERGCEGTLLAIRSDRASSLPGCQREILRAKRLHWPTLVVELLLDGEDRSFPYGGNTPVFEWRRSLSPSVQSRAVALQAIVQALAWRHHQLEAERVIKAARLPRHNVEVFTKSPELLDMPDLRMRYPGPVLALHPDPELSVHERRVLLEHHPRLRLVTPASSFRGHLGRTLGSPLEGWRIGFSFADSPDVGGPEGTTRHHVGDVVLLLARSLFCAGAHIAYGSDFRKNSLQVIR
ncbi:MAG: hypothetical protein AAFX50_18865, partial [Acidobacteriota bacterium]